MYSIEWQKRGLPHAHILIWLVERIRPDQIDDIICAEIPNPEIDPDLHDVIITNMIHGPCGTINSQSPCMVDGKCSKRYPPNLTAETITGNDGYPMYRRRSPDDNGRTITTKVKGNDFLIDNTWIVPYSPLLSKTFKAHCNVEYCNSVKSIKYICKYVTKGSDMAVFGVQTPDTNNEITHYQVGRYVSCNETIWRIFSFPIHERHPTVVHFSVHLENGQRVYFNASNVAQRAETPPATTLTSFFSICQSDPFARTLLYSEMPRYYTWNASSKKFQRQKQGDKVPDHPDVRSTDALGRIYTVHPKSDECFYLRLLLVNVRGPTSFESLRTINSVVCPTFRAACQQLNLLENDTHWDMTIAEAIVSASPSQIRTLFAIIISTCFPSNPRELWNKYKGDMSEDILHRIRVSSGNPDLEANEEMYNQALLLIEDMCYLMCGSLLVKLGMPTPDRGMNDAFNRELEREREYDRNSLNQSVRTNVPLLNPQQKEVYDTLMKAIDDGNGGLFFLDAPGGTGKTFLMSLILATVRVRSEIAVAVASSGIAATLLEGCRTTHSALKLPLNLQRTEKQTCNIAKHSATAKVLVASKIIIWAECTMAHKRALEALNRTMKDLRNDSRCFGGAMILLSGDFRQTLPVIPRSTAADEINACLKSSTLWRYVKKL
jgi:ATP-dependent DNA helicase PIF1